MICKISFHSAIILLFHLWRVVKTWQCVINLFLKLAYHFDIPKYITGSFNLGYCIARSR
jgi:hypothetical protein